LREELPSPDWFRRKDFDALKLFYNNLSANLRPGAAFANRRKDASRRRAPKGPNKMFIKLQARSLQPRRRAEARKDQVIQHYLIAAAHIFAIAPIKLRTRALPAQGANIVKIANDDNLRPLRDLSDNGIDIFDKIRVVALAHIGQKTAQMMPTQLNFAHKSFSPVSLSPEMV
jgi:hypothetical protein